MREMHKRRRLPWGSMVTVGIICAMGLGGCASKQMWYQPGKMQVDYDRDAQECTIIAKEFARQATMNGTSEDPLTYQNTLQSCLVGKGWSMTPPPQPGDRAGLGEEEVIAVSNGQTIRAFGGEVKLPGQFALVSTARNGAGPVALHNFLYRGPADTFINVLAQKAVTKSNRFQPTPYPVQPPFFLYERGEGEGGKQGRQWAIFCGKIKDDWVMGLGSYILLNNRERITVIVTRQLMGQQTEPQPGFQLSAEQFPMVEAFKKEWLPWLTESVVVPNPSVWSRLPGLR